MKSLKSSTVNACMAQTTNAQRKVPTRRISFEASLQDLPQHFAADGDLIIEPRRRRRCRRCSPTARTSSSGRCATTATEITDPELKRQVAGFIGQEVDARPRAPGVQRPPRRARLPDQAVRALHRSGAWRSASAFLPPISNLAATAALEHFTATLAELRADRATRSRRRSATRRSRTCSSGTRSRSPSTRPSPSTSTRPSAAASGSGS